MMQGGGTAGDELRVDVIGTGPLVPTDCVGCRDTQLGPEPVFDQVNEDPPAGECTANCISLQMYALGAPEIR